MTRHTAVASHLEAAYDDPPKREKVGVRCTSSRSRVDHLVEKWSGDPTFITVTERSVKNPSRHTTLPTALLCAGLGACLYAHPCILNW